MTRTCTIDLFVARDLRAGLYGVGDSDYHARASLLEEMLTLDIDAVEAYERMEDATVSPVVARVGLPPMPRQDTFNTAK